MIDLAALDFAKGGGFVTVVTRDARSGTLLMVARADHTAIERSIADGEMWYHSRTRGLWHKGATSGNVQRLVSLDADCDGDVVLASVVPAGPSCHTGTESCFGDAGRHERMIDRLTDRIESRRREGSESSYTRRLFADRNLRLKKIGEESAELVVACADRDTERAVEEAADLLYHTLVALAEVGANWTAVEACLARRAQSPTASTQRPVVDG
jgi:phosphoribosyl-AMP cyclohydrolase / phosphoribosyl-ATP pyrophosphohydrolase